MPKGEHADLLAASDFGNASVGLDKAPRALRSRADRKDRRDWANEKWRERVQGLSQACMLLNQDAMLGCVSTADATLELWAVSPQEAAGLAALRRGRARGRRSPGFPEGRW